MINFLVLVLLFRNKTAWRLRSGTIALIYLVNYSVIRIVLESWRADPVASFFGIRLPILVSGVIILGSLATLTFLMKAGLTLKKD